MELKVKVMNKSGLHARPAAMFIQKAKKYESDILVIKGDREVSAKNILGVMSLEIIQGTEILLKAEGSDAAQALKALEELVNSKFGEE